LKELVEYIAKSLVDDPTEVRVVVKQDRREIRVELKVAEQDMGRIIGRNGWPTPSGPMRGRRPGGSAPP
jgi:predicted RNA-binding protein YlqC (UPF0109 family)